MSFMVMKLSSHPMKLHSSFFLPCQQNWWYLIIWNSSWNSTETHLRWQVDENRNHRQYTVRTARSIKKIRGTLKTQQRVHALLLPPPPPTYALPREGSARTEPTAPDAFTLHTRCALGRGTVWRRTTSQQGSPERDAWRLPLADGIAMHRARDA